MNNDWVSMIPLYPTLDTVVEVEREDGPVCRGKRIMSNGVYSWFMIMEDGSLSQMRDDMVIAWQYIA